jgi:Fe-S-cluster containining protein
MSDRIDETPWYGEGLKFACLPGCRRCCGGAPGDVWVTEAELTAMAASLSVTREEFERCYVRRYASGRASLRERHNGDCVLLDDRGCGAYAARPQQCRDYPFWPEVLDSPLSWEAEKRRCPGLDEGPLHSVAEIDRILRSQDEP